MPSLVIAFRSTVRRLIFITVKLSSGNRHFLSARVIASSTQPDLMCNSITGKKTVKFFMALKKCQSFYIFTDSWSSKVTTISFLGILSQSSSDLNWKTNAWESV